MDIVNVSSRVRTIAYRMYRTPVRYSIHYLCNVSNTPSSDSWCCFSLTVSTLQQSHDIDFWIVEQCTLIVQSDTRLNPASVKWTSSHASPLTDSGCDSHIWLFNKLSLNTHLEMIFPALSALIAVTLFMSAIPAGAQECLWNGLDRVRCWRLKGDIKPFIAVLNSMQVNDLLGVRVV